jgi:transglutaminase/protease-like cytokinesis protein 3
MHIKNKEMRNDKDAIPAAVEKILNTNPELNYIKSFVYSTDFISFSYYFSSDTVLNMQKSVDEKAKEIINSIIKPGMTEFEKELAIHDYVVKHTKYDYDNLKKGTIPEESYTAYGVLNKGTGVCQGYAIAIHKLMSLAGIESKYVTGTANGVPHAWNIVKINNEYYHLDATLNDPVTFVNGKRLETLQYKYFNINDKQASKDHVWKKNEFPKCTSTKYSYRYIK